MTTPIQLGTNDWFREVAKEARVPLHNRFFEQNPVLTEQPAALIARPGMKRFLTSVGDGPVRAIYSQPGSFESAAFVASGDNLYRIDGDASVTFITNDLNGGSGYVSMAATGNIGSTPEFLFIADGTVLLLYIANGYARGTLTGTPANGDVVRIDLVYYQFTNASVDAGTPAGTLANPWLVALGGSSDEAFANLGAAVGNTGTAGSQYSTALTANDVVTLVSTASDNMVIRATDAGVLGNAIITTETGAALAWGAGTLTDGGDPSLTQVATPDDVGIISVGYIGSYVIVVPAQGQGINGRFFWIEPGEITIDPLNFATAERAPDPVYSVVVFGDNFWLPGQSTTEVWYMTGSFDAPVARLQGITFDRGTWEGTAIQVKDSMFIVDADGGVFQIAGGIERVSNPAIEERIREAMQRQSALTP